MDLLCNVPDITVACNRQQPVVHSDIVRGRRYFVTKERVWYPDVIPDVSTDLVQCTGSLE